MKEVMKLTEGLRGLNVKSVSGKMMFPDRSFSNARPGLITDVEITLDKEKYSFINAKPIKLTAPSVQEIIDYCTKNTPYKVVSIDETRMDGYGNKFVNVEMSGESEYNFNIMQLARVLYDDGTTKFDEFIFESKDSSFIHEVGRYYDSQLRDETFTCDVWTKDNNYRIAELFSRNIDCVYMSDKFILLHYASGIYGVSPDRFYACILNNNSIIKFPVTKNFVYTVTGSPILQEKDNILNDIVGVLKDMPVGVGDHFGFSNYVHMADFYVDRMLDFDNEDDRKISKLVRASVINVFQNLKRPEVIVACINNKKLGYFESLSDDDKENAWDFIDGLNNKTDEIITSLSKQKVDPMVLQQLVWKGKLCNLAAR